MADAAKAFGRILQDVLKGMRARRPDEEEIGEAWRRSAGEAAAAHTRPVSFRKSLLVVHVDGSGWLYELSTRKRELIARLGADLKGKKKVKDIRFRIGDIRDPAGDSRKE